MTARVSVEDGVAFTAVGIAVVQTINVYREAAPTLKELRCATPNDFASRQLMLDADLLGLIIVVCVGGGAAFLTRRWYPVLLSMAALLSLSVYYRSVLKSPNVGFFRSEKENEHVRPQGIQAAFLG